MHENQPNVRCPLQYPDLNTSQQRHETSLIGHGRVKLACIRMPFQLARSSLDGTATYTHRGARSIAHQAAARPLHSTVSPSAFAHPSAISNKPEMEYQNKEVDALVQKITGLHAAISKLPSLSPCPDVDALFTDLVTACVPASPVDVTKLGPEAQQMREGLIRLCSEAEGKLEAHYSDMLAAFDNPLDHLGMFPYYSNYINLSKLEYELLVRYVPGGIAPARVAFIGSGPLPFSSFVLAAHHLPDTVFDNYDLCGAANERASKLFRADTDVGARMLFHTADVADLAGELGAYDVVFLAALVGMAAEEKAKVIAHLGAHMADGAALVVRSAHGARGFLYPVVDPEDIGRGGFEVLAVCHPDDDVVNSVIIARKSNDDVHADGLQSGRGQHARRAVPVVSPPCRFGEMVADVTHKREEFAKAEVAF
ncbi:hypothetical protein QYE76_057354 [Lolium multiflorum]|uniref:Nicotianamine synthase n=1 Tax=Lolium multiflorum TaxID=4521 RepID=A0AAD8T4V8_LOLMU|nr:hypothetical protein QYE76_057354 [Lolium multiflorum]